MEITSDILQAYSKCPARIYMKLYGDKTKKVEGTIFGRKKNPLSKKSVLDLERQFQRTIYEMKNGFKEIKNALILSKREGYYLVGQPSLLKRKKGKSNFGEFYYEPCDVKSGKNAKNKFKLQISFYAEILEDVQGKYPKEGCIITTKNKIVFDPKEMQSDLNIMIGDIISIYSKKHPGVFIRTICNECSWRKECMGMAKRKRDLSLISGINLNAKNILLKKGIKDIVDLSKCNIKDCLDENLNKNDIKQWKSQAIALVEEKPLPLNDFTLPKSKVEIYFDIEGVTERARDYLYGIVVRKNGEISHKAFFASSFKEEGKVWKQFLDFMSKQEDFVIYHYAPYEKVSMKRMYERYGGNSELYEKIKANMVDLYVLLRKSVVMPLHSYSLKKVGTYLGYFRSGKVEKGIQSIHWFRKYQKNHSSKIKNALIEYNKQDCIATMVVKDWLESLK